MAGLNLGNGTGIIQQKIAENVNILPMFFYYFFIPVIVMLLFIIILKYKDSIISRYFSKKDRVTVWMIRNDKKLIRKSVKVDKYNNFVFKEKMHSLEKMLDFIIGYDEYNSPVFLYDENFILPLRLTKEKLTKELKKQLYEGELQPDKINDNISALSMVIDSHVLKTVYDRKLLSDLYSISGLENNMRNKIIFIILICIGLVVMYYTGLLGKIMDFLGIQGFYPK